MDYTGWDIYVKSISSIYTKLENQNYYLSTRVTLNVSIRQPNLTWMHFCTGNEVHGKNLPTSLT
jgi:hypothetical protein